MKFSDHQKSTPTVSVHIQHLSVKGIGLPVSAMFTMTTTANMLLIHIVYTSASVITADEVISCRSKCSEHPSCYILSLSLHSSSHRIYQSSIIGASVSVSEHAPYNIVVTVADFLSIGR